MRDFYFLIYYVLFCVHAAVEGGKFHLNAQKDKQIIKSFYALEIFN